MGIVLEIQAKSPSGPPGQAAMIAPNRRRRRFLMFAAVATGVLILAACRNEPAVSDYGLAGFNPDAVAQQRAACDKRGGRFGRGGQSGAFVCYENTSDANKSCSSASDCDGLCLARSATCTPVKPLFGCHEILTLSGTPSTLCID